jgi:hypothetical protein
MTSGDPTPADGAGGSSVRDFIEGLKGKRWLVWTAFALAILVLIASSLTIWVRRQALNTDNWVNTSTRMLQDEQVRSVIAADMVDALFANTDVATRLQQVLPPRLDPLAAPAAGLLRQAATTAANDLLQRPAVQTLWQDANRVAHKRLVAILNGNEGRPITTAGGDVVLNLQPLVDRLAQRVGFQLNLPPDAGQITIMKSNQLAAAQDAVKTIKVLSIFMVFLVFALLAIAIYFAEGFRREVLRALAVSLVAVGIVLLVVRRLVGDAVVDALTSPSTKDAGTVVWLIGTELLRDLGLLLIVYGIVLLIGVLLAGPARWATGLRRRLAPAMRHHVALVYACVAVLFLLFMLWGPSAGGRRVIGVLVLAGLTALGVEMLRRQILRENAPTEA